MLEFLQLPTANNQSSVKPRSFENEAVVHKVVQQGKAWRISFEGTFWTARCTQEVILNPGDVVYVVGRQSITLLIESIPSFGRESNK